VALGAAPAPDSPPAGRAKPLYPVDLLLLGYLSLVSAVALARTQWSSGGWWLVGAQTLFVLLLVLVTRPGLGAVGRTLREIYPLLLLVGLYGELDVLNGRGVATHDPLIQRWEMAVFGAQVSRDWWQSVPSRFWSTVFHGAYFSYYFIVAVPAFYLVWRDDFRAVRHFVLAVMLSFVACYVVFIFFPVAGPYYEFHRPAGWFTDNWPARLVYTTLASGSSFGAAFPSSHVAGSVAATLTAARWSRPLGMALVIPTTLLTIGVVYCQMHYGVDALAGLVVGGFGAWWVQHVLDPETGRPRGRGKLRRYGVTER